MSPGTERLHFHQGNLIMYLGGTKADRRRHQVFGFVQGALAQSAHNLLSAGPMTLAQAVDFPSAAMRAQV